MLSRRHIRIKVMQSLYSYLSSKNNEITIAEKAMLKHFDEVIELKLVIISLLLEIINYADNFYEDGKKKHLPSACELDPNIRFVKNKVVVGIFNDKPLMHKVLKVSSIWLKNDHDGSLKYHPIGD